VDDTLDDSFPCERPALVDVDAAGVAVTRR